MRKADLKWNAVLTVTLLVVVIVIIVLIIVRSFSLPAETGVPLTPIL